MSVLAAYRLYLLDGAGMIDSADWIEAAGDAAALAAARARFPDGGFELWIGKRLVRAEPRSTR